MQAAGWSSVAGAVAWPVPTAASFPPTLRLLSQDSLTGQHRAVLSRCLQQGHELLEVTGLPQSQQLQARRGVYSASAGQWVLWVWCAGADPVPSGVGQQRAQPQRGPHGTGEAWGGLHGG